jgi:two-component system, sensor histidine kinase and response regulator
MVTILIIDDEPAYLSNLAMLLEFEGFTVITAHEGQEALETASKNPVDLILCDMLLEPINGFQILQTIRQQKETTTIPFIFVTGVRWDMKEAAIPDASGYLQKPFSNDQLLKLIREFVGG